MSLPFNTCYDFSTPAITEPWPGLHHRGIMIAKSLVQPHNHQTKCRLINLQPHSQILRCGTILAYLSPFDKSDEFNQRALRGEQNQGPDYISSLQETTAHKLPQLTIDEMLTALTDAGLTLDKAKKRLTPEQFKVLITLP